MKKISIPIFILLFTIKILAVVELPIFTFESEPRILHDNINAPLVGKLELGNTQTFKEIVIHICDGKKSFDLIYPKTEKNIYPIVAMRPEKEYKITFTLRTDKGIFRYEKELNFKTPSLPSDPNMFPKIDVTICDKNLMAKGFTLFNPRRQGAQNTFNKALGLLVAIDDEGDVVWYYTTNSRISDFDILNDGNFSFMTADHRIIIIDVFGNTIKSFHSRFFKGDTSNSILVDVDTFHHDVTMLPDGNFVTLSSEQKSIQNYYSSERDKNAPRKTQKVIGDVVVVFDKDGKILWKWNAFDYLDPFRIGYETFSNYWNRRGYENSVDWSHANAVSYDSKDDAFLVNFRYLSAILKIDRKTKKIVWIFGEPSGYSENLDKKLIKLDNAKDYPWHQHSPKITEYGTILFFNNDNYRTRPFDEPVKFNNTASSVVEYEINPNNLNAKKIWTSNNIAENINSVAMGDVDMLPNGNILVSFGALIKNLKEEPLIWSNLINIKADKYSMLREYEKSTPPKIVWEMKLLPRTRYSKTSWSIFGGERFVFFGMQ